jgi:hypothetical protein
MWQDESVNVMARSGWLRAGAALLVVLAVQWAAAQTPGGMPGSEAETLSGKHLVVAEVARGHRTILVMGFSKDAGDGCTEWSRTLRADPALAGVPVYGGAMLAAAPGFIRGLIKSALRKSLSPAEQEQFLVLVTDEAAWRAWFGVGDDKQPYVVVVDAAGRVAWRGHGAARELEGQVRKAFSR